MTPTTNVRIWWDSAIAAYRMTSPYNKSLVDTFKKHIPYSDRSYDETTKIWTFVERQLIPTLALMKLLDIQPVVITRQQAEQASQSSATGPRRSASLDTVIVEFVKLCPADAMNKAYRAAAMALHPDRGGSMDKMSALNALWDRIQKEVYHNGN